MHPNDQNTQEGHVRRGGSLGLFYLEKIGPRHYLRFTRLALLLIVCLVLIPILLLFTLYLSRKRGGPKDVNVDIVVPTQAPYNYNKIQPAAPPPTPPKVSGQPGVGASPRQTPLAPNGNASGSFIPSPMPSPTLARPPT